MPLLVGLDLSASNLGGCAVLALCMLSLYALCLHIDKHAVPELRVQAALLRLNLPASGTPDVPLGFHTVAMHHQATCCWEHV